jgi:hypothetical protein
LNATDEASYGMGSIPCKVLKYYSARPFFDFVGCDADNHVLARVEIRRKLEEAPL